MYNEKVGIPENKYYAICEVTGDGKHDDPGKPDVPCSSVKAHATTWYSGPYTSYEDADKAGRAHDCNHHQGANVHQVTRDKPKS